jgi:hypothetical protein
VRKRTRRPPRRGEAIYFQLSKRILLRGKWLRYSSHRRAGHFNRLTDDIIDTIIEHASNAPHEASGVSMIYWHGSWPSKPYDNAFGFRRTGVRSHGLGLSSSITQWSHF